MTETVTLCPDITAPPDSVTFTHERVWTRADGWRVVAGFCVIKPDAPNRVVWVRARLCIDGLWQMHDVAFGWDELKRAMEGDE